MALRDVLLWMWRGADTRSTLASPSAELAEAFGGARMASGISVTPDSAMRLSAVSACVRLISESIASLPLIVYRRQPDGGRARVVSEPAYRLLHDEPNNRMSSYTFRETMCASVLLHGNAYAYIQRTGAGEPFALLPVDARSVRVSKLAGGPNSGLAYDIMLDDVPYRVDASNVLHVPGLAFDGLVGISPVRYAAESIGLGIAAERYGASFFGNGSMPSGYVSLPGTPKSKEAAAQFRAAWESAYGYGGGGGGNRTAVLFEGAKFERVTIPPNEAQFIESRKFQVSEIARWFLVPPHKIGDLERATFSNIEHQALEFVTTTLRPWLVRFEQEFNRKLFPSTPRRASDLYCEHLVEGLLRGDVKARGEYYTKGRQWGWLSANDIRRAENMDAIDGGDEYLVPLNMTAAGADPDDDAADSSTDSGAGSSNGGNA